MGGASRGCRCIPTRLPHARTIPRSVGLGGQQGGDGRFFLTVPHAASLAADKSPLCGQFLLGAPCPCNAGTNLSTLQRQAGLFTAPAPSEESDPCFKFLLWAPGGSVPCPGSCS